MEPDLFALQEEASSVDSSTGIIYFQYNYSWVSYCAVNISMEDPRTVPPVERGMAIKISFVLPSATAYISFFFFFPSAANKYPPPSGKPDESALRTRSFTGNEHVMQYKYSADRRARWNFILYIHTSESVSARIVQTRDSRTVNPNENKSDAKNDQQICWTVVLLTLRMNNIWRVNYMGKLTRGSLLYEKKYIRLHN